GGGLHVGNFLGRHGFDRGGLGAGGEQLALPFGYRFLAGRGGAAAGGGQQTCGDGLGDHLGQQRGGADRVVVTGYRVVDLIGIAVGVEHRDDGDVQLAGLADGDVLLLG